MVNDASVLQKVARVDFIVALLVQSRFGNVAHNSFAQPFGGLVLRDKVSFLEIPLVIEVAAVRFRKLDTHSRSNDVNRLLIVCPALYKLLLFAIAFKRDVGYDLINDSL